MYLGSFLKNLFKPRNFFCVLYLVLNMALVFCIFGYVLSVFNGGIQDAQTFVINGCIGIGINIVITLIALSPLGEAYVRRKENTKILNRTQDTEAIFTVFYEVYGAVKAKYPKLGDKIKLYYKDTDEVNAYALGHRTIIVTHGLLQCMDTEKIKGILAHEFGHIVNGDSDLKLGISVSNGILLTITVIINALIANLMLIVGVFSEKSSIKIISRVIGIIGIFLVTIIYGIWAKIGMLIVNATSRKDEYEADTFAVDCGYGKNLYDALNSLDETKTKSNFFSLLASTHPDTVDRLKSIQTKLAV